jgi:hypothetical protein
MMKKRYLFPLVNISALIGCGLALFVIPPTTSLKLFGIVCLGAIVVINVAIVLKIRATQKCGPVAEPPDKVVTIFVWLVSLYFLVQVVRGILKYWHAP